MDSEIFWRTIKLAFARKHEIHMAFGSAHPARCLSNAWYLGSRMDFRFVTGNISCKHDLKIWSEIRSMQAKNYSGTNFLDRTERLATRLGCTLRELGPKIGISSAMFFGCRSGKYDISLKTWRKLEAAEKAAGIIPDIPQPEIIIAENRTQYRPSKTLTGPYLGWGYFLNLEAAYQEAKEYILEMEAANKLPHRQLEMTAKEAKSRARGRKALHDCVKVAETVGQLSNQLQE